MLNARSSATLILAALLIVVTNARGQARVAPITASPGTDILRNGGAGAFASITVTVADENGMPLTQQALVKLSGTDNPTNLFATTQDRSQAIFEDVLPANYEVEISAAGYDSVTKSLWIMAPIENYDVYVRLRLTGGGPPVGLPGQMLVGRARTEAQKGIADLNAGKFKDAQKHLTKAYKISPGNADLNYLMAILSSRSNQTPEAESYLQKAVSINSKHVRALTMLGQLRLREKDYKGAVAPLEQAVSADKQFWMARWLLADAYLKTGEFEKSREQAEAVLQEGKGDTGAVELVLGQALANLGKLDEAVKTFGAFLAKEPGSPAAASVRRWIAQVTNVDSGHYQQASEPLRVAPTNVLPLAILMNSPDLGVSVPTWHPPSVDDEKLTLAAGAVCPAAKVIAGAGRSAERLVDSISRFEATERVTAQELDVLGKPETTATRKFDYMASIDDEAPAGLLVDESRVPLSDKGSFPDHISARGIAALALVFHPVLRVDYDMTCEGLGQWKGRATWLVYFRQRSDRPNHFLRYEFTDMSYSVDLKGRAWIAADNFQIVHLETDLLHPMRQIQLLNQHQSVDYGPVHFQTKKAELWLPKTADIYFDFRRHRYHRSDNFADFKLFAVASSEKIAAPDVPTTPTKTQPRQ